MIIQDAFLKPSQWSRPSKLRTATLGIVVHWVGNAMQTAQSVRQYFDQNTGTYASANFVIGLQGEILRLMPWNEMAYHCGSSRPDPKSGKIYTDLARKTFDIYCRYPDKLSPNQVTIGIECCHLNRAGEMSEKTLESLKELVGNLCKEYHLDPEMNVFTHNEIVGWKDCHKWFVDNPDIWVKFKSEIVVK